LHVFFSPNNIIDQNETIFIARKEEWDNQGISWWSWFFNN
jgi:hypothetical protein